MHLELQLAFYLHNDTYIYIWYDVQVQNLYYSYFSFSTLDWKNKQFSHFQKCVIKSNIITQTFIMPHIMTFVNQFSKSLCVPDIQKPSHHNVTTLKNKVSINLLHNHHGHIKEASFYIHNFIVNLFVCSTCSSSCQTDRKCHCAFLFLFFS